MRVALLVDNPDRDLPGLALVAERIAAAGAVAYLVPMNLAEPELSGLAPHLALLTYLRRTNEALAARLAAAGIGLAVLDTEGGVMEDFAAYQRVMARERATRFAVRRFLAWGPRLGAAARAEGWYRPEAVRVTGNPRFDLYAPPWREAAARAAPAGVGLPEPVVLVAGTYTLANPRFGTPEAERRMLIEELGLDPAFVDRRLDCERRGLHGMAELANRLAAERPGATFVLRPHPFEGDAAYRELLDGAPNLHLGRDGAIAPWLLRARALVQRGSTTAIEAALAGVPALSALWLPSWARLEAVEAASVPCPDPETLLARLDRALAEPPPTGPPVAAAPLIEEWFSTADGRAHERVAGELLGAASEGENPDVRACRELHYRPAEGAGAAARAARLRRALRLPRGFSFRRLRELPPRPGWERSGKAFDAASVQRWTDAV
ncbi:MAG TPA: surface carbohydrate biosynthesis protein, partial [Thermoanaerobaculia bacterium]|nr:surface carbohydrate biosynthesis protein [Thermoanaerobaculia bacterium]